MIQPGNDYISRKGRKYLDLSQKLLGKKQVCYSVSQDRPFRPPLNTSIPPRKVVQDTDNNQTLEGIDVELLDDNVDDTLQTLRGLSNRQTLRGQLQVAADKIAGQVVGRLSRTTTHQLIQLVEQFARVGYRNFEFYNVVLTAIVKQLPPSLPDMCKVLALCVTVTNSQSALIDQLLYQFTQNIQSMDVSNCINVLWSISKLPQPLPDTQPFTGRLEYLLNSSCAASSSNSLKLDSKQPFSHSHAYGKVGTYSENSTSGGNSYHFSEQPALSNYYAVKLLQSVSQINRVQQENIGYNFKLSVENAVYSGLQGYTARTCVALLFNLGLLQCTNGRLLSDLCNKIESKLRYLKSAELVSVLQSTAMLSVQYSGVIPLSPARPQSKRYKTLRLTSQQQRSINRLVDLILPIVRRDVAYYPAKRLVQLLSAVTTIRHHDLNLYYDIAACIRRNAPQYQPYQIASCFKSFATMRLGDVALYDVLAYQVSSRVNEFSLKSLSDILWSCSEERYSNYWLLSQVTSVIPQVVEGASARTLVSLFQSFACLRCRSQPALDALSPHVIDMLPNVSNKKLITVSWACKTLRYNKQDLMQALVHHANDRAYRLTRNQAVSLMTCFHGMEDSIPDLYGRLKELCTEHLEFLSMDSLVNLLWLVTHTPHRDIPSMPLLNRVRWVVGQMEGAHVARVLRTMQSLLKRGAGRLQKQLMADISQQAAKVCPQSSIKDLVCISSSMCTLRFYSVESTNVIVNALLARGEALSNHQLCTLVTGWANVGVYLGSDNTSYLRGLLVRRCNSFTVSELTGSILSLAILGVLTTPVLRELRQSLLDIFQEEGREPVRAEHVQELRLAQCMVSSGWGYRHSGEQQDGGLNSWTGEGFGGGHRADVLDLGSTLIAAQNMERADSVSTVLVINNQEKKKGNSTLRQLMGSTTDVRTRSRYSAEVCRVMNRLLPQHVHVQYDVHACDGLCAVDVALYVDESRVEGYGGEQGGAGEGASRQQGKTKRVAVLINGPRYYCRNSPHEMGTSVARKVLLQSYGWEVVVVNIRQWGTTNEHAHGFERNTTVQRDLLMDSASPLATNTALSEPEVSATSSGLAALLALDGSTTHRESEGRSEHGAVVPTDLIASPGLPQDGVVQGQSIDGVEQLDNGQQAAEPSVPSESAIAAALAIEPLGQGRGEQVAGGDHPDSGEQDTENISSVAENDATSGYQVKAGELTSGHDASGINTIAHGIDEESATDDDDGYVNGPVQLIELASIQDNELSLELEDDEDTFHHEQHQGVLGDDSQSGLRSSKGPQREQQAEYIASLLKGAGLDVVLD